MNAVRLPMPIVGKTIDAVAVDRDVETLRSLTKQDIIDFYNVYIDPESRRRSKASVQMHAAAVSDERKLAHAEALAQFLSAAAGVVTEESEVMEALEGVDIKDADAVVAAVRRFLRDVKNIGLPMIDGILVNGRAALDQAIPVKELDDETFTPSRFGMVFDTVEDVVAWKASCRTTAGPIPVKPLVEFADTEAKL